MNSMAATRPVRSRALDMTGPCPAMLGQGGMFCIYWHRQRFLIFSPNWKPTALPLLRHILEPYSAAKVAKARRVGCRRPGSKDSLGRD
jgi:hypothetical protein